MSFRVGCELYHNNISSRAPLPRLPSLGSQSDRLIRDFLTLEPVSRSRDQVRHRPALDRQSCASRETTPS